MIVGNYRTCAVNKMRCGMFVAAVALRSMNAHNANAECNDCLLARRNTMQLRWLCLHSRISQCWLVRCTIAFGAIRTHTNTQHYILWDLSLTVIRRLHTYASICSVRNLCASLLSTNVNFVCQSGDNGSKVRPPLEWVIGSGLNRFHRDGV